MPTPEQLERGSTRITGSTIASCLGYDPYCSPSEAVARKNDPSLFTGNAATNAGIDVEPGIANMVARELEIGDFKTPDSIFHPDYHEMFVVHPDLISMSRELNVQIKNHDPWVAKTLYPHMPGDAGLWGNLIIPMQYRMQVQLEMDCLRGLFANKQTPVFSILAVYFGGARLRLYKIKREPMAIIFNIFLIEFNIGLINSVHSFNICKTMIA